MYLPVHLLDLIGKNISTDIEKFNFYSTNKELYRIYKKKKAIQELEKIFVHNEIFSLTDIFFQSEWYRYFNYLTYLSLFFDNTRGMQIDIWGTSYTRANTKSINTIIQRRPIVDALTDVFL